MGDDKKAGNPTRMETDVQSRNTAGRKWGLYITLCVLLFCLRAFFVLSIYPPLEGWDEYQHVAYVEYILQHGDAPVFNDNNYVPRSLHKDLVRFPHSIDAVDQLQFIGGVSYEDFWKLDAPPEPIKDAPPIRIYQAQHSSLYYRLVAPFYAWAKTHWGFLGALTLLRAINVLFGAAAIVIALWTVGRLVRDGPYRYLIGLLVALQPLFLLNCARVANDAPAVLFGTAAVCAMLLLGKKPTLRASIVLGLLLGIGILFKTVNLGLLPMALFVYLYAAWKGGWRRGIGMGVVALVCVIAVTGNYFAFNLHHFGMLTPMQEAIQNRNDGKTLADYVDAAKNLNWYHEIESRYLRHSLWRGGWSMILPEWRLLGINRLFVKLHEGTAWFAAVGILWMLAPRYREERLIFSRKGTATRIGVLWIGMTAALCYHMLQSVVALPNVATNIWYAAVTFPWLIVLLVQGFAAFPRVWMGSFLGGVMAVAFLGTELYGTRVAMVKEYAQTPWGDLARQRLAQLHVSWWGPNVTTASMVAVVAIAALCFAIAAAQKHVPNVVPDEVAETETAADGISTAE